MDITPIMTPVLAGNAASRRAVLLAAETVLAALLGRAPTRVLRVSLGEGVEYALEADIAALQANRGLLEAVVMVRLAASAARRLLGELNDPLPDNAADLLGRALTQPEEQAIVLPYLQVLEARATALLRTHWAEVQVVAAGLSEMGELSGEGVRWRMDCAQGIRGRLLN